MNNFGMIEIGGIISLNFILLFSLLESDRFFSMCRIIRLMSKNVFDLRMIKNSVCIIVTGGKKKARVIEYVIKV